MASTSLKLGPTRLRGRNHMLKRIGAAAQASLQITRNNLGAPIAQHISNSVVKGSARGALLAGNT